MKYFIKLLPKVCLVVLISSSVLPTTTWAYNTHKNLKEKTAKNGLIDAIADANKRLNKYRKAKDILSLMQTSEDKDGNISQQKLKPIHFIDGNINNEWQTLRHDKGFSESVDISNDILFNGLAVNAHNMQLVSESESNWVFSAPNNINVTAEENTQLSNQDMVAIDSEIAKNLFTEVVVDKNNQRIKSLKIYAKEKFKPSMMVSIEKFELRLDYQEAWQGGPLIRHNFTRHIKGSYGWFVTIEDLITTKLTEIKKLN